LTRGEIYGVRRPEVELAGATTRVLVEQLRAVDLERLGELAGRLVVS
jgi:hypothetical protein